MIVSAIWRQRIVCVAGFFVAVCGSGCERQPNNPESAVRLFLRAAATQDTKAAVELLSPADQAVLQSLGSGAATQAHHDQPFAPEQMIALAIEEANPEIAQIRLIKSDDHTAEVELTDRDAQEHETLRLIKVGQEWRINLDLQKFIKEI